jgi:ornithine decarboxylase
MNTPATLSVEDTHDAAPLNYLGRLRSQPRPSVRRHSEPVLLDTYASSDAVVADLQPAEPVFCFLPAELRAAARRLVGFPGRVLYAVKCNPHPFVLQTLYREGITDFDVASLDEIKLIGGLFEKSAGQFFNNPAKTRPAIRIRSS